MSLQADGTAVQASGALAGRLDAPRSARILVRRRRIVLALNATTVVALTVLMGLVLGRSGLNPFELGMLLAFVVTLPWLSIGLWNALIGAAVLRRGDPLAADLADRPGPPIAARTAVVMALRNEDPDAAICRLRALFEDLARHGEAGHVAVHVLSDTSDTELAAREEAVVARWREASGRAGDIHYRRRACNGGFKAGNIREFCDRAGDGYDYLVTLDADSLMSAPALTRLLRLMERRPEIGIAQSLVVGTPSSSFFTRAFQFGMRHGMRAYTAGSAWWTGDCGPYWGHNAVLRMRPFHEHCGLPKLPGDGPLGGAVMSHDQVEAVLMRRAGSHVRVLVEESDSFEENPPTLPDFIRRELRWCQGNMQYFQLLAMQGLEAISRVQLALAILMYLGPPAWMGFIALGAVNLLFHPASTVIAPGPGLTLFAAVLLMGLAPKLMGVAGVLLSQHEAARYGGRRRVLAGALAETLLSMLIAPIVAFAIAMFALGLLFGKKLDWRAQSRGERRVGWREATISFAPQTLFGLALAVLIALRIPQMLPFAAPMLIGLVCAIPIAVVTASPALGRWSMRHRLCAIPEEVAAPPILGRLAELERQAGRTSARVRSAT